MPDCYVLRLWQVNLALTGKEAEALDLVGEAAGELRRSDELLRLTIVWRLSRFVVHEEFDLISNRQDILLNRQDIFEASLVPVSIQSKFLARLPELPKINLQELKRNREEEKQISLDYITEIHEKHEIWLNKDSPNILILDGDIENSEERLQKFSKKILQFIMQLLNNKNLTDINIFKNI